MKAEKEHLKHASLIKAPFFKTSEIQDRADEFRNKFWEEKVLPIDIIKIIEQKLRLDLIPISTMKARTGCDALLSRDCKSILIDLDEFMDDRYENRLRFSCAHEIGHLILHKDLYSSLLFETEEDWIEILLAIPEKEYSFIEFHANEFAGNLLVPKEMLITSVKNCKDKVKEAFNVDNELDPAMIKDFASSFISKEYGVSSEVILRRLDREQINLDYNADIKKLE